LATPYDKEDAFQYNFTNAIIHHNTMKKVFNQEKVKENKASSSSKVAPEQNK
jgi:hypothetical protein